MSETPQIETYSPSEILTLFSNYLSQHGEFSKIIYIQGIYQQKPYNPRWSACYDTIRDPHSAAEMTIKISKENHDALTNGNLIVVGGILGKQIKDNGNVQILLNVTRVEKVQDQVVDETEQKKVAIRQQKAQTGYKNVDGVLEQRLYADQRPQVALVFAESSITMADFMAGVNSAMTTIDFRELRANFANHQEVCSTLSMLDNGEYDVIAIVRGGGSGIEHLDDPMVLDTISRLNTPTIGAVGHPEERLFFKTIVDKEVATPTGLGQYFSELTERISETKAKSKAALVAQVEKQYKERVEAAEKQNQAMQKQMEAQNKQTQTILEQANKKEEERKQLYGQVTGLTEQIKADNRRNKVLWGIIAVLIGLLIWSII